jgi:hypothetical protein
LPVSWSVTFTMLPKGRLLCAAVMRFVSKSSPLEVVLPWNLPPYQEASPSSWTANPFTAAMLSAAMMKTMALIVPIIGISFIGDEIYARDAPCTRPPLPL